MYFGILNKMNIKHSEKNSFFGTVWSVIKPINRPHAFLSIIFYSLAIYDLATLSPPKVITDLKRVQGTLIDVYSTSKSGTKAEIKVGDSYITLNFPGEYKLLYSRSKGKPVVAYYWPRRLLNYRNTLVLMAPLSREHQYLLQAKKDNKLEKHHLGLLSVLMTVMGTFISLLISITTNVKKKKEENQRRQKI